VEDREVSAVAQDPAPGADEDPAAWPGPVRLEVVAQQGDELGMDRPGPGLAGGAVLELAALAG
jgi:hypothetical protein